MGQIFEKKYELHTYDFDRNGRLKPISLMNYLQDISTVHFETATAHLPEDVLGGVWVIVDWQVEIEQTPVHPMTIVVRTEPTYFRKFIAYRRYVAIDAMGNRVATAISKWAYIDPEQRKQCNIPIILNTIFGVELHAEKPPKMEMRLLTDVSIQRTERRSAYADIDVNQHVNNVSYLKWTLESIETAFLNAHTLKSLNLTYKKEVLEDERVKIETKIKETDGETVSRHDIYSDDMTLCVQVELIWESAKLKPNV